MPIDSVVADANVLLSAAIGKSALRVLTEYSVQVHVTRFNAEEVREYLPRLAAKYHLPRELAEMQWKLLPIRIHEAAEYEPCLAKAERDLASRDPEDAHALALARCLQIPLWSNDHDLAQWGVACFPTRQLLAILGKE